MGFQVYCGTSQRTPLSQLDAHARRAEALGYDGLNVPEAVHDGFLAASVALQATQRIHVATSVTVAFPRSPMAVAIAAWDLAELSGSRFELGLGSQVKGNIEGRYGTPWTPPVQRMRDYVGALRAIFDTFQTGTKLAFESENYSFSRMQPFFCPEPLADPTLPIGLGGVGPKMTELAGELADGLTTHPTNTAPRYLRDVLGARLNAGAERGQRSLAEFRLLVGCRVATGPTEAAVAREREAARRTLAFLYSTPAYWKSLEIFGWEDRGVALRALTREEKWDEMAGLVDDEMLDTFVPQGTYDEIVEVLQDWYGDLTSWITFPLPPDPVDDVAAAAVIERLRA
jgi:probable F420-dependent oxidoreductase